MIKNNIRQILFKLNKSLTWLSIKAKVDYRTIQRISNNENSPNLETSFKIVKALGKKRIEDVFKFPKETKIGLLIFLLLLANFFYKIEKKTEFVGNNKDKPFSWVISENKNIKTTYIRYRD